MGKFLKNFLNKIIFNMEELYYNDKIGCFAYEVI